jgi:hypothetical protein
MAVFYLPRFSPELNPDERLNADFKHAIGSKVPARNHGQTQGGGSGSHSNAGVFPGTGISYFHDWRVKYDA